jgi:hypothetical protein
MSITSDRPAANGEGPAAGRPRAGAGFPADSDLPASTGLAAGAVPGSVAAALAMADTALGYLRDPGAGSLVPGELGGVLEAMGVLSAKLAAARAAILSRFDAERAYAADGYGSCTAWLKATGQMTGKAAGAETRRMRQFRDHPVIEDAVARGQLSESWAGELAEWTRRLPPDWRHDVDKLLVDTAAAGANLEDLAFVARAAYEKWRQQSGPDGGEDDGFDDRYLKLGTTIDNAGRVTGNLTPECTAALQAVLDSLGKKEGPEDDRTEAQRYHDALQLACELLLRADLVPDRAGADTRVDAVIDLARLLDLPGAGALQEAWLAALAGQHGYLAGTDAEAAVCDALVSPVVVGHPDLAIVDQMIDIVLAFLDTTEGDQDAGEDDEDAGRGGPGSAPAGSGSCGRATGSQDAEDAGEAAAGASGGPRDHDAAGRPDSSRHATERSQALSPEAWQALRYAIARLAVDLVSGPDRLASILRQGLLDAPYTSKPVILDVGYSATIPAAIRRAVQLRARHCEWPGCRKPPAHCDIHHLRHKSDGGETSLRNCVQLCQFHHDICIHRWGWRLVLHPDATTTAYGPKDQVLHSHGPSGSGPPRNGPPDDHAPPGTKAA